MFAHCFESLRSLDGEFPRMLPKQGLESVRGFQTRILPFRLGRFPRPTCFQPTQCFQASHGYTKEAMINQEIRRLKGYTGEWSPSKKLFNFATRITVTSSGDFDSASFHCSSPPSYHPPPGTRRARSWPAPLPIKSEKKP